MVLGIFTKLCIGHNHLISEHFHLQKNPILISIHSIPYSPSSWWLQSPFYNIQAVRVPFCIHPYQYLLLFLIRAILVGMKWCHTVYGMHFLSILLALPRKLSPIWPSLASSWLLPWSTPSSSLPWEIPLPGVRHMLLHTYVPPHAYGVPHLQASCQPVARLTLWNLRSRMCWLTPFSTLCSPFPRWPTGFAECGWLSLWPHLFYFSSLTASSLPGLPAVPQTPDLS